MTPKDPTQAYRQAAIENAPPLKLVQLLYQGTLRFLHEARTAHEAGDLPHFNDRVGRAQAVVSELRSSLDMSQGPDLCDQLDALYTFSQGCLTEAIIERSPDHLDAVEQVMRTLLEAWRELDFQAGAS